MNLTQSCLKRPVTTVMIFVCFVAIGIIVSQLLPLEFFPDLDVPYIGIQIPYPNSTPEEIEREITRPAEEVLATISGIKKMTSNSGEHNCYINLEFDWGIDANVKALEAKEKLDGVRHQFPDDLERFYVRKFSTSDMSIMTLRLSSNRDLSDSYEMLDRNLKKRIERIDGVSKVEMYGVEKKEIRILLNKDRLIAYNVDINRLTQILSRSNFMVTAGKITDSDKRFVVRPLGEIQTIDDIGEVIVADNNIRLRDIAEITYRQPTLDYGRHLDRKYAIGLDVYKEAGANTVEVTQGVKKEIEEIGKLNEMRGIRIFFMDDLGEGIVSSLNELLKSGLLGGLLAVVVLFFFLRRISTTLMVAIAVPFSLLITLAFQYFLGVSLNILSMMGLMLAVGMLVDNAVVVTESIHRHQLQHENKEKAIKVGVQEVALAITAGTLTTAIVFLPNIVNSNDEVAIYLKHVSITLCIALGTSLILAQTIIPLMVARVKPPDPDKHNKIVDALILRYSRIIDWSLNHRRITIVVILVLLFSIAVPISMVKMNMFDEPSDRKIYLRYHIDGTYTVEKVESVVDIYEDYLFENQQEFEINSVYTYYTGDYAMSTILLEKGDKAHKSMNDIEKLIRDSLPQHPIARPSFERSSTTGRDESIRVQLIGKSSEELADLSRQVAWSLTRIQGLKDVRSEAETGKKEVQVVVDRQRVQQVGLSTRQVAQVITAAMRGIRLRRFRDESGEIDMRLSFQAEDQQTIEDLKNVPLFTQDGTRLKLASLADFTIKRGPVNIHRENRTTAMGVEAYLDGISMSEARRYISQVLSNYQFPAGYTWNYGESFSYEDEAFNSMLINLLMALALIYFLMAALFESLLYPAAIWTQIIFSVVGVYWFFLITGTQMTIMGMIGILILIGVVVNNGIVLIDYVNQLRHKGLKRHEAIVEAGKARLRPILMTAGTTVLSLLPLCVVTTEIGGNGPPYFPMARAMVGGLTFSTVITLLVLPTIYVLLDDLKAWAQRVIAVAAQPLKERT